MLSLFMIAAPDDVGMGWKAPARGSRRAKKKENLIKIYCVSRKKELRRKKAEKNEKNKLICNDGGC